ncbi:MAG TPA: ABC transporter ATP-binding protein [Candidatus Dormibacteraeota bacterium]|jgi:peptide/nickel transport system ATP-binding protein|nr:ABC transporter ATP-binding protein [Candidatus Dormibacteraeota bacterium]
MTAVPGEPLLEVDHLALDLHRRQGVVRLVDDISFTVHAGESTAVVGESGSGKTLTALAVLRLLPPNITQSGGSVVFRGRDMSHATARELRALRRGHISAIFQDPSTSLNPAFTVGNQLVETIRITDTQMSKRAAVEYAAELLHRVGIPSPRERLGYYPHQLSGGMAQRAMIALAIASHPALLVADEPTTALDVTVQAQILELLASLREEQGMSLLLISHDLSVVSRVAEQLVVVYAGQVVERGATRDVLRRPAHPYTEALLEAQPSQGRKGTTLRVIPGSVPSPAAMPSGCRFASRCAYAVDRCVEPVQPVEIAGGRVVRCVRHAELSLRPATAVVVASASGSNGAGARPDTALLRVDDLVKRYPTGSTALARGGAEFTAVESVSFQLERGETLGLVGESGAGKSTVGRLILGLAVPTSGSMLFDGAGIDAPNRRRDREIRRRIQVVFQNPYATLDPLMTVGRTIAEPLQSYEGLDRAACAPRVAELLEKVGLDPSFARRYPGELSGGQRQRVAIARALAPRPDLIVCDEPVSSLDVSTQAQVINVLEQLQRDEGLSYLFIGHDLSLVYHISHRVAVMYRGRIVELNTAAHIYDNPQHPYTKLLLASRPQISSAAAEAIPSTGAATESGVSLAAPHTGCPFATRCPAAMDVCTEVEPEATHVNGGLVRCHLYTTGAVQPAAIAQPAVPA